MPRGKELQQLPMSNIAPGAGQDRGPFERSSLKSITRDTQPQPSSIRNEQLEKS
ncbi:malate dehydrogenase [Bacillus sp. FJAT-18017]|uniref:hypothetical protein n=1 Tax=Bacillus sp. FJAT-18017 TaxID=1705566 RepID=UPI0006AECF7E|nr:hypothetical protein [Bacillus sp. FJAT-18017]ALC90411.1 malate dehydrogenase [Bacillus sp. FJAT-18017]